MKASLPASAVVDFVESLAALADDAGVPVATLTYPTTGLVLSRLGKAGDDRLVTVIEQARRPATGADGSLLVTQAPPTVKQRIDIWGESEALPLMRRLKEQFDPRAVLNPGRFVGRL